jgi:ABC-type transport system involved in multi-copper enzyme maturation permease subunit
VNAPTMRALLEDAFYQVLDNKIFRLLLLLVLVIVAPTFLIGFREDSVQILYGWREISYDQLLAFGGQRARNVFDPQTRVIQGFQALVVEGLIGNLGMVFCVSATAFFIPRMLEKGSADILFSKPVSRLQLMLSRYVAGLLFVGILSFALVFGIYLGLVVVSGYNDPGFLWGAVTLFYLFAILHAFSIFVGVVSRSTVAAIMLSLFLFMGSGCVHQLWRFRGYVQETQLLEKMRVESSGNRDTDSPVPPILEDPSKRDPAKSSGFVDFMIAVLDVAHYTLPKTSDADVLTRKLRKAIARREILLTDDVARLTLSGNPEGFELSAADASRASAGTLATDLEAAPVVWIAHDGGREVGRAELSRKTRLRERPSADSGDSSSAKRRPRRLGTNDAVDDVLARIKSQASPAPDVATRKASVDGNYAVFLTWTERTDGAAKDCESVVFTFGDWMFELKAQTDESWISAHELEKRIAAYAGDIKLGRLRTIEDSSPGSSSSSDSNGERFVDPSVWYEQRFGWSAEPKYNAWLSIASSVAFGLAMLSLAWLKLRRIDF